MFSTSKQVTVSSNAVSNNGSHGIYLVNSDSGCVVSYNTASTNDAPASDRGGINGIRIGDRTTEPIDTVYTHNHAVEFNEAFDNEDTGIEFRANAVRSRYNRSWSNGDHGYDHLYCVDVWHVGDLSVGNDRSGMSFEANGWRASLRNCVIANNGRDANRRDYEIELDSNIPAQPHPLLGFSSKYNVVFRDNTQTTDSVLIAVGNVHETGAGGSQTGNDGCSSYGTCYGRNQLARFQSEHLSGAGYHADSLEAHSRGLEPTFVNSAIGDFTPVAGSAVIDAADTTVTGHLPRDIRGYVRHDYAGTANSGYPGGFAYADIGPYEFDSAPGAPTIDLISWGRYDFSVNWVNSGDDGAVGTAGTVEVLANNVVVASAPVYTTGAEQCIPVDAASCTGYSVKLRITEVDNGKTVESNTVTGSTLCSGTTTSDCTYASLLPPEESSAKHMKVGTDYALALDQPSPNPMVSGGLIGYSIPRALSGKLIDLAIFDISGRRTSQLVAGAAKAGRFNVPISGDGAAQRKLHPGVYYARLRIGGEVFTRTIVLTH